MGQEKIHILLIESTLGQFWGISLPHFFVSYKDNGTLFWPLGSHLVWPPSLSQHVDSENLWKFILSWQWSFPGWDRLRIPRKALPQPPWPQLSKIGSEQIFQAGRTIFCDFTWKKNYTTIKIIEWGGVFEQVFVFEAYTWHKPSWGKIWCPMRMWLCCPKPPTIIDQFLIYRRQSNGPILWVEETY